MLLTVAEFKQRVHGPELERLLNQLATHTGRFGAEERNAWRESLTRVAGAFDSPALDPVHLYLGDLGALSLEYRLPASASWCDVVLLGSNGRQPSAVVIELKHWDTWQDTPAGGVGLIQRPRGLELHPAEQVKGYVEYCRNFHSAVLDTRAAVNGCVVFTRRQLNGAYRAAPNEELVAEFPCFSVATKAESSEVLAYLNNRIVSADREFAEAFDKGHYRQNRSFISAIGGLLRNSSHRHLELLDEQRKGFFLALAAVREAVATSGKSGKRVVIVEGPPGSGKSAIAARLWAELATARDIPQGDLAFVTTSLAQNHNLEHLFGAGAGAVKKASQYSPISLPKFLGLSNRVRTELSDIAEWRKNTTRLRDHVSFQTEDNAYLVSIVDEAHALINPESSDARGPYGFPLSLGPQGYHIIRSSVVSVFLIDSQQGFREQETTQISELKRWAAELGAEVSEVSLAERQFRCGGSAEYIEWAEGVLGNRPVGELHELAAFWRARATVGLMGPQTELAAENSSNIIPFPAPRQRFQFEVMDSPPELDAVLTAQRESGASVRLVASYARKWVTEKDPSPHSRPPQARDFVVKFSNASGPHLWTRIWNWRDAPQGFVSWVNPSPGVPMAENPLAEIGCPYTVRGFDFDYLGVLWFSDIVWRDDHWEVQPNAVFETGLKRYIARAKRESDKRGPEHAALMRKLMQGYRILLTRALKGILVWCEDDETRQHLRECLNE